jgi:hypothetical protein
MFLKIVRKFLILTSPGFCLFLKTTLTLIPTDSLLLIFLSYSRELSDFCDFSKVPDASKITRFKQDFLWDLQSVFENLVVLTEPICQSIDAVKADMTIFDTSGIDAWVTENNPKSQTTYRIGLTNFISYEAYYSRL